MVTSGSSSTLSAISGANYVCVGSSTPLSDANTGGVWSTSGTTTIATIGSVSGIVTGEASGTSVITYTLAGTSVTTTLTVAAAPGPIMGNLAICSGFATGLSISDAWLVAVVPE